MSKVWYVIGKYESRFYRSERAFLSATNINSSSKVIIYEEVESGITGEIYSNILKQKEREQQLNVILGTADEYSEKFMKLVNMYNDIAKDEDRNKKYYLKNFKIIGPDKKKISSFLTGKKRYFLMYVSNSVEWYKTLLECHNFTTIDTFVNTTQESIDNFNEAKRLIKLDKVKNKKRETI